MSERPSRHALVARRGSRGRLSGSSRAYPATPERNDVKATERWYSERLQHPISLARWGHYGAPVLVFPTAGGDAEEIERNDVVAACGPLLDAGRVKIYSCDSTAGLAMVSNAGSPEYRM